MKRICDSLFEPVWTPIEPPPPSGSRRRDDVLILAGDDTLADALRWASERAGVRASVMDWTDAELDDEAVLDARLRTQRYDEIWLVVGQPRLRGRALAPEDLDDLLRRGPGMLAACARSLVGLVGEGRAVPCLRVLSSGACAAEGAIDLAGALQAPAWGLARAIAAEHPELDIAIVDLDPGLELDRAAAAFVTTTFADDRELALRGPRWLAPRLVPTRTQTGSVELDPCRDDAAYLVVGGLGRIGRELGRGLVERGARHLVLAGLRVLAGEDQGREFIADLEHQGITIELARVDIRDRAALVALRRERELAGRPPIRGVVHAAMGDDVGPLVTLDPRDVGDRMAIEVAGSWNLHAVFGRLDPFLLCTAAASMVPALAQGHGCQAGGHGFQHALADALRSRACVASAIAFGQWTSRRSAGAGLGRVDRSLAAKAIDTALTGDHAQLVCAPLDRRRSAAEWPASGGRLSRLLADADLRRDKPWVSLGGHGDGRPLFLLHPLSGETSCYTQLADRLAISRPLVGLRSPALFDPELRTQQLADIAVAARREARLLVADGPLDLLGWGFGGALAFEMARQELDEDRGVGLVAMVDTELPRTRPAADDRAAPLEPLELLELIVAFLAELGQLDPGDRRNVAARVELERAVPGCRLDLAYNLASTTKLIPRTLAHGRFAERFEIFAAHSRAFARWRPHTLDASVHYFVPSARVATAPDHAQAWLPRVAELVTHRVPGGHYAITNGQGAAAVAEVVRALL